MAETFLLQHSIKCKGTGSVRSVKWDGRRKEHERGAIPRQFQWIGWQISVIISAMEH